MKKIKKLVLSVALLTVLAAGVISVNQSVADKSEEALVAPSFFADPGGGIGH